MAPRRSSSGLTTLLLPLVLFGFYSAGSHGDGVAPSGVTIDPANFVTSIAARLARLEMLVGDEVDIREDRETDIRRLCSHSSQRIKSAATDLLVTFEALDAARASRAALAGNLLKNIGADPQQCSCYASFIRTAGVNWNGFVNDLTAMAGEKQPQSTWTCNVRDGAMYHDRPLLWRR